jgi:hypothetical protein
MLSTGLHFASESTPLIGHSLSNPRFEEGVEVFKVRLMERGNIWLVWIFRDIGDQQISSLLVTMSIIAPKDCTLTALMTELFDMPPPRTW